MSTRVVIFGTSTFGLPAFNKLTQDKRFKVVGVISQPAKPSGRHQILSASPITIWAQENDLPIKNPTSLRTPEVNSILRTWIADVFIVAAYGLILPQEILDLPKFGCLNIHASLLPKYRGASPIAAAIINGDQETGITFIKMDAGCDTGPILHQVKVPIEATDTRIYLEDKLALIAAESIGNTIDDWLHQVIIEQPQSTQGVTTTSRLSRKNGLAEWDDAEILVRKIRAYQPWPGVWTNWKNHEFKILTATFQSTGPIKPPGTIVELPGGWAICCRRGYLVPSQVQFGGKKSQFAKNVPGSYPDFIGSVLV